MIDAAKETYPSANSIEWNPDKKLLKVDGVIVDHKPLKAREDEFKILAINEVAKNIERQWIESELEQVRSDIEDKIDAGLKAPKLRKYRIALKAYKSNLYMPNISRPTL